MVSGIHMKDEHVDLFNELKIDKKHRFLVFGLNSTNNGIDLISVGSKESKLADLKEHLPSNDCRFVVYDFDTQTFENPPRDTSRLLFILWAPDAAPIKRKVPAVSTKGEFKAQFVGIQKDLQISDFGLIDEEEMRKECVG